MMTNRAQSRQRVIGFFDASDTGPLAARPTVKPLTQSPLPKSPSPMDILLSDDEPQLVSQVRRMFEKRGHRVDTRGSGVETLDALEAKGYSLLVLDWGLPDIDGVEVVSRLRQQKRTIPILMLTGKDEAEDVVRALDAGADDFVTKGDVKADVLVARAEALFRRSQYAPSPRRIEAGPIVVDEASKTAFVSGEPIDLAPSELKVLAVLAASLGRIVTRAELVAACWGEGVNVSDNALESVIKRLRKKLGREAERLQSVRLRGYVLVDSLS